MSAIFRPPAELEFEIASEHVHRHVPVVSPTATVSDVQHTLKTQQYDSMSHIAVCDTGQLVGVITIEALFKAEQTTPVSQFMDNDPPIISPHLDQEVAVRQATQRHASAVAVVDDTGQFVGFIPPAQLIAILLWEHEEDMIRLGGFLRDTSSARAASLEGVTRRFLHRIPWLLVGVGGAIIAADVVGAFEAQLQETVTLAFFVPGIVYLADAVGTQTETLVVRGLSVGVRIRDIVQREIWTGLLIGLTLALTFFPLAYARWQDQQVALSVALAIFISCSTATLIALMLPWGFHKFGKDPAYGTGPLATVIQDILAIMTYFLIAMTIIQ